jgi:hypothetical protein
MTPVSLADSVYLHFGTSSASTGAATNADSTPTVTIEEDGIALGYAPTVSNVAVGLYRVQIDATAGNGFEAGKRYSVYAAATVGGVTGRDGIGEFECLGTDLDVVGGRIDVAISTRLATAGYTAPDNAGITSISSRLPAALVGGRIDASVGAMAADVLTAAAIAADAVAEIQSGLAPSADTATLLARLTATRAALLDNLVGIDATVSSRLAAAAYTAPDNTTIGTISTRLILVEKVLRNKLITDPTTGIATLYDNDSSTPLLTAQLYENASGTQTYRSQGVERRERFA